MLGVVAIIKVQEGKGEEFEAIASELAAKVRENEPGNLLYQLTKSRAEPRTYKVLELYKDEAAMVAHRGMDHFRDLGRKMGAYMDGRAEVEILDAIG